MEKSKCLVLILILIASCQKQKPIKCTNTDRLYACANFYIGAALDLDELKVEPRYKEIAETQFNSITPENHLKAATLHPFENQYNWLEADEIVNFGLFNSKKVHGHTLIWHADLPQWIINYQGTKEEWESLFKDHIQTICKHFKGKVSSWDVVNEAFNNDGTLRNSIWKEKIGSSYIEKAFRYAEEADPNVLLFYNDYDIALNETKRKAILSYLNNLRQRGVKVDGIGMQMHISISHPENSQILDAFMEIAKDKFLLHLSEIDISLNPLSKDDFQLSDELLERQAEKMQTISLMYQRIPTWLQYGITFWGISDKNSWIRSHFKRKDYPLLFDDEYKKKLIFEKFNKTL